MNKRMKLISFALILILLLLSLNTDTVSILIAGDPEVLKDLSHGSIFILLFFTILLMTIQNMLPIIPLVLLVSVNVSIFGLTTGFIWSWLISIVGAVLSFMIARYWFQSFFNKIVKDKVKQKIKERGFWYVWIGRVLPIMPTSVINIAAGVSTVRFSLFLYATVLGNMIYILILSLISQGLLSMQLEMQIIIPIAVLVLVAYAIMKVWRKKQITNNKLSSK
ncbi:MAG: hypothetical protein K0R67_2765 [Paenibacillus sp.]|nr:hypothetical protein [Paenibacillus sp.]